MRSKISVIILSLIIQILTFKYLKMDNRNLFILIFSTISIILNRITLSMVLKDVDIKFKKIYLASIDIFLLNILLYTASGYFADLLLYNKLYKILNFVIIINCIYINVSLIFHLSLKKKMIIIPILYFISSFIAYLTLGFSYNLLINILISFVSIFFIEREKKMKIKIDVINLLNEIIRKKYSNLALNNLFDNNSYSNLEKSFINHILNITLKNLIYIDYVIANMAKSPKRYIRNILRVSIAQLLYSDSDERGIIYEAVEIAKLQNEYQAKFVNATLRNFLNFKEQIYENASVDIKYSYPKWIVEKIKNQFGEEKYIDVLKSYKEKSYFSVRVNFNKLKKEDFLNLLNELNTEILFNVGDVYYLNNNKILKTKAYLNEDIYIQDASSYLAAYF